MRGEGLSRRALFGAGLTRALGTEPALALAPAAPSPPPPADDREQDPRLAGAVMSRLAPVGRVLVVGGSEPLAEAALAAGCEVVSVESGRVRLSGFDVVLAGFGAGRDPARREVAAAMRASAAPGAALALLAWPRTPWARYETAYRNFFGLPDLDVEELATPVGTVALVLARQH